MPYSHIRVERNGGVFCVRLRRRRLGEADILGLGEEVDSLIGGEGCRKLAFSLRGLDGLYSVLLGKLLAIRRRLLQCGGTLTLHDAAPQTLEVFEVCGLTPHFRFAPDQAAAVAALAAP